MQTNKSIAVKMAPTRMITVRFLLASVIVISVLEIVVVINQSMGGM